MLGYNVVVIHCYVRGQSDARMLMLRTFHSAAFLWLYQEVFSHYLFLALFCLSQILLLGLHITSQAWCLYGWATKMAYHTHLVR